MVITVPDLLYTGCISSTGIAGNLFGKTYAVISLQCGERYSARVRIDQLLNLGWKIMIPLALLNLLVTGFLLTVGVF